jgi:phosphatidylserine/phosphatidylglycerophosphate/cardiolipin synthase-like enzyme
MSDPVDILSGLPGRQLEALAIAMGNQWITLHASVARLAEITGSNAVAVSEAFTHLRETGFTDRQGRVLLQMAFNLRTQVSSEQNQVDLVLSGPDVPGIPTAATDAVVQTLFLEAKREIILAGYAFHNARVIFEPLSQRMQADPTLKVILYVDISRGYNDTSTTPAIVARFANDFWKRHWPWQPRPEVYYDPRALSTDQTERACLHAKFIAIDGQKVFITSANFTEAAQKRNIEAGLLVTSPARAQQLIGYFEALLLASQMVHLNNGLIERPLDDL